MRRTSRVTIGALAGALALGGIGLAGGLAGAQDAPGRAPPGAGAPGGGGKGAPPVVEATPSRPVDLSPLLRALGLIGPEERVVRVLSMAPTTDNVRDVLRLLADMAEVEIEVAGKDGRLERRRCGLPGRPPASHAEATAEDAEFESLASEVALRADQREAVRDAIRKGQALFERRLAEASRAGARDITVIEKIGEEVSKEVTATIRGLLDVEQRARFDEYMRGRGDGPPAPGEPGDGRKAPAEPPTPTARPA